MSKNSKFGMILTREGILSQAQLDEVLAAQALQPYRAIGEIASERFAIPEEVIESVFASHILPHVVQGWFFKEIGEKLPEVVLETTITAIDVQFSRFTRSTIIGKEFEKKGDGGHFHGAPEKKYLQMIHCELDSVTIKTAMGPEIVFQNLAVKYDIQSQRLKVEQDSVILEAKFKINRILKGAQV